MHDLLAMMRAETTPAVQIWMLWMVVILSASILFVAKHTQARWALLVALMTAVGGFILWRVTNNVHLLGIVHLILWVPLALYLWRRGLSKTARPLTQSYRLFFGWMCLLLTTIVISLVFDIRDLYPIFTGQK